MSLVGQFRQLGFAEGNIQCFCHNRTCQQQRRLVNEKETKLGALLILLSTSPRRYLDRRLIRQRFAADLYESSYSASGSKGDVWHCAENKVA